MNRLYNYVKDSVFSYNEIGTQIFNMSVTPWGKLYNLDFIKRCGAQFAEGIIFHDNIFFWDMLFASEKIYFYNKTLYIHIYKNVFCLYNNVRFLLAFSITICYNGICISISRRFPFHGRPVRSEYHHHRRAGAGRRGARGRGRGALPGRGRAEPQG